MTSALRRECALGLLGDLAERFDVVDGDIGQGLAVQRDVRLQQAIHEAAVAQAVHAGRGVDTHDPQRTELALALLAADVCVLGSLGDGLLGDAEDFATGVEVALRQLDDFLVATTRRYTTFNTSHDSFSSKIRQHAVQTARVFGTNMVRLPQVALTFGRFLGENVATVGMAALVLAGSGLPEAFGGGPVGLDLGLGHGRSFRFFIYWPRRWLSPHFPSCLCRLVSH